MSNKEEVSKKKEAAREVIDILQEMALLLVKVRVSRRHRIDDVTEHQPYEDAALTMRLTH